MAFCDFVVRYDPDKEAPEVLTDRILYALVIKRLKHHKPAVLFLCGESGEGKSFTGIRLQEKLLELQGLNLRDVLSDINVYVPIEYPQKLQKLLFPSKNEKDKARAKILKKTNIICMHEAREVVRAKNWQSFLNQAIGDVNAQSRSIKRLCIMVVSQSIRDISTNIRYTLNYYCKVRRPLGKPARLYINVLWKDDRDLEKIKLRKRKLSGYIVGPDGRYRRYVPQYFIMSKPSKENVKEFEAQDLKAKMFSLRMKIRKLIKNMEDDMDIPAKKIDSMVDFYTKNTESLNLIGRRRGNNWFVKKDVREMHDLSDDELKLFQEKLNKSLQKRGVIDGEE